VLCRKFHDPPSVSVDKGTLKHDESISSLGCCCPERTVEFIRASHLQRLKLNTHPLGRNLRFFELGNGGLRT
jgi:hypothetical protein